MSDAEGGDDTDTEGNRSWPTWLVSSESTHSTAEDGVKTYHCEDGTEISFQTTWPTPHLDRYGWRPIDIPDSRAQLREWESLLAREPSAQASYGTIQNAYSRVLYPVFLPFASQKLDRVETLRLVHYFLSERRKTAGSFKYRHLAQEAKHLVAEYDLDLDVSRLSKSAQGTNGSDACGANHTVIPLELLLVHGAYPIDRELGGHCFANPSYVHHTALPDVAPAERGAWLRKYAGLGADFAALTDHFGASRSQLKKISARQPFAYRFLKWVGRQKLARTWKTIREWKPSLSVAELATAFNTTDSVVYHHLATVESFEPPTDPTVAGERLSGQ